MEKIGLVTDEGADLTHEIIEKYDIGVVPVKLDWPEIQDLPGENVYQKMREVEKRGMKTFGKTSQPSPKNFLDVYNKQFEKFEELICVTIVSKLSGTYNSAIQAKKFLPAEKREKVFVVDSLNASGAEALMVLKAQELLEQGELNAGQIAENLEKFWRDRTHLTIVFQDPKWIEFSGRMSSTVAGWVRKMGNVGIRPVIGMQKGALKPMGVKFGAKDTAVALAKTIQEKTKKSAAEGQRIRVVITHGDNLAAANRLKGMVEQEIKNSQIIFINLVNNVVGAIAGPDALALSWSEG